MPRADDITEVVDFSFAQGFSVVRTRILNRVERIVMKNQCDSLAIEDEKLGLISENSLTCFRFAIEDLDPFHKIARACVNVCGPPDLLSTTFSKVEKILINLTSDMILTIAK
jgi:hypothetical protein